MFHMTFQTQLVSFAQEQQNILKILNGSGRKEGHYGKLHKLGS